MKKLNPNTTVSHQQSLHSKEKRYRNTTFDFISRITEVVPKDTTSSSKNYKAKLDEPQKFWITVL